MRFLRCWLFAALAVCCITTQASAQTAPAAGTVEAPTLRAIEGQVSQIRGLPPLTEPDLRLLDRESLNGYLTDQLARNYLPSEREADQKELVALGLLQPDDDVVQIQLNLLNDQIVGIYDTDARSMFLVFDQGSFGPAARVTYAHEFTHALQDQYFDLRRIAPRHQSNNDQSLAAQALIEGDALLVQTFWAVKNLSQDDILKLARGAGSSDDVLAGVPLIARTELLFPYTYGLNFVRNAYIQAGNSFAAVDNLFKRPPESTAQVLHPEKYRDQVHPVDVQIGDLAASLGPDWRKVGAGVLGELDTRVLLQQWGAEQFEANRIAAGWSGDRWQMVENNGRTAIVVKSTWESPSAASDFFEAYTRGLRRRFSGADVDESSATRQALTTPVTATDVRLQGNTVLIVIAFDRDSANTIVDAVTTFSL